MLSETLNSLINENEKVNEDFEYDKNTIKDAYYDLLKVHGALGDGIFSIDELYKYYLSDFKAMKTKVSDLCSILEKTSKGSTPTLTSAEHRALKSNLDSLTSSIKKKLDDRNLYKCLEEIKKLLQLRYDVDKFVAKTRML